MRRRSASSPAASGRSSITGAGASPACSLRGSCPDIREASHAAAVDADAGPRGPGALAVLPTQVVNAADGGPVADRAVWSALVVVLEPVWQGLVAVAA